MTTPPRVWFEVNGESDAGADIPWDPERVLHGVPVEVQPIARWLEDRLRTESPIPADSPPPAESLEVVAAGVRAVREAIVESGDRGTPAHRVQALHAQLDREFAFLVLGILDRRTEDSRSLLRDVSHDLRSPLNSILFLADALATEHSGALNDVQQRQVGVLYTAAVSLVGLVNDLIDVTRLGDAASIDVASDPFSVEAVLQEVDQLVGPLATHGDVKLGFRLETLGPRRGDRRILTRILINLVSNAVHVTGSGHPVEVRAVEHEGGLRVTVTDSGSEGDVEQLRARLRDSPFPAPGARTEGWTHGLGLAICSRLVDASNGAVSVDATSDGGCRFTVDLPFPRD
ncbi:MAG: sensor histidine kinase [Gemmatimonadota bacterium]